MKPKYEKIVKNAIEWLDTNAFSPGGVIRMAVEQCEALQSRPKRLSEDQIDQTMRASTGTGAGKVAKVFAKAIEDAHIKLQNEPEVIKVEVRYCPANDQYYPIMSTDVDHRQGILKQTFEYIKND